jgi:hypothetical protein
VNDFSWVKQLVVPQSIADETQKFLRAAGRLGNEGMVLWVGKGEDDLFHVTDLLIPKQKGIRTREGVCVVVDTDEMHRINVELFKSGLRLIAQVHSHPTHAYHSETDDEFAIATTVGCFSLVVPDFGARDFDLSECAVYRLSEVGQWQHLAPQRVKRLIDIRSVDGIR